MKTPAYSALLALAACSATARPIPQELAPLPVGPTVQIATAADAGVGEDASRPTLAPHTDAQRSACVDSHRHALRVRSAGADRYVVSRGVLEAVRTERKGTLSKAVDPTTGQQIGYTIVDVGDGSCLEALGFRSGDLVRTLNGHDLIDWEAVRQAFVSLEKDGAAIVRLQRAGKIMTVVYELQN